MVVCIVNTDVCDGIVLVRLSLPGLLGIVFGLSGSGSRYSQGMGGKHVESGSADNDICEVVAPQSI